MVSNQVSELLEENPEQFLKYLKDPIMKSIFEDWVKYPKSYSNWFSPALTQLIQLVGDLTPKWRRSLNSFFGKKSKISEDIGIEIFDLLMEFKPDLEDKDYYDKTFMDKVKEYEKNDEELELMRQNNERFLQHVKDKLNSQ